ncbi:hypothetical protein EYF80_009529 [Liparis tanakae]|uniref:Uncharacterized protein n=1 Tax=Liparis tanakae TaxID=230148 RepID=A0A4Z2IRP0_9TELE|nr:hypothetical protein EYF80_009529 [Liparis tanakae]
MRPYLFVLTVATGRPSCSPQVFWDPSEGFRGHFSESLTAAEGVGGVRLLWLAAARARGGGGWRVSAPPHTAERAPAPATDAYTICALSNEDVSITPDGLHALACVENVPGPLFKTSEWSQTSHSSDVSVEDRSCGWDCDQIQKVRAEKQMQRKLDLADDGQTDGRTNIKENHLGLQFHFRTLPVPVAAGVWPGQSDGTEWMMRWGGGGGPSLERLWKGSRRRGTSRPWRMAVGDAHCLVPDEAVGATDEAAVTLQTEAQSLSQNLTLLPRVVVSALVIATLLHPGLLQSALWQRFFYTITSVWTPLPLVQLSCQAEALVFAASADVKPERSVCAWHLPNADGLSCSSLCLPTFGARLPASLLTAAGNQQHCETTKRGHQQSDKAERIEGIGEEGRVTAHPGTEPQPPPALSPGTDLSPNEGLTTETRVVEGVTGVAGNALLS